MIKSVESKSNGKKSQTITIGNLGEGEYSVKVRCYAETKIKGPFSKVKKLSLDKNWNAAGKGRLDIPDNALKWNKHYYACFNNCLSWEEAKKYCETRGGHLATITSHEENEVVFEYLLSCGFRSGYFGYTDNECEGMWRWVNDESSNYTNWHSGEPNAENYNEDYAEFYYKFTDGTWNDGNFGNETINDDQVFICEWERS